MSSTVTKRSLIKKYISDELYIDLLKSTKVDLDNNTRAIYQRQLLDKYNIPWTPLGVGTNRQAVMIEGYAVKLALDDDGKIDSRREMLYSKDLQPYVVKTYECIPDGLVSVSEYVSIFERTDFNKYQDEIRKILEEISDSFLIGDVGISTKNYVNWGIRTNGQLCILDYAYIYNTTYGTFMCSCKDQGILRYDKDFNDLICPICGKKMPFRVVRRRITKTAQEEEIGDIRRLGYNLTKEVNVLNKIDEFEPVNPNKKQKKDSYYKQKMKEYKLGEYKILEDIPGSEWDYPDSQNINMKGK